MDWTPEIRNAFSRRASVPPPDVVEELAAHAASLEAGARARGEGDEAIRREVEGLIEAWADLGPARFHRRSRGGVPAPDPTPGALAGLGQDLRYAVRLLRRAPGPSLVSIATVALAVAAATVTTGLVWHVLLKPLPWRHSDRLVRLYEGARGGPQTFGQFGPIFTNSTYRSWQVEPKTIEALAAWRNGEVTLTGAGAAERVRIATVTASLAAVTGAAPALGRWFHDADELPTAARTCVLSHGFWKERFGGRPEAVGQSLTLDGKPHTILGVMPPDFAFPDRAARLWRPLHVPPVVQPGSRNGQLAMFSALARLRPGFTPEQAAAEGTARAQAAPTAGLTTVALFGGGGPPEVRAVRALEAATREVRPALLSLLAAVALLLGVLGGAAGLALAAAIHAALPWALPPDFPRLDELAFDAHTAAVAFIVAAGAGLATGLLPALHAGRASLSEALTENAPSVQGGSPRVRMFRDAMMAAQVAAAATLLAGAVLLGRSFLSQLEADRGFDTTNVLTALFPMAGGTPLETRNARLEALVSRLERVPGVERAAFTNILPLTGSESMRAFPMSGPDGAEVNVRTAFRVVSPGYFRTMGARVVEGRGIEPTDTATSRPVAVVNRTFARRYLDATPLGEVIPDGDREVVGILEDIRPELEPSGPEMFVPHRQNSQAVGGDAALVVRTAGEPNELVPLLRSFVQDLDPTLAPASVRTLEDRLGEQLARPRLYAIILLGFATLALTIAGVGLFGVISYTVAQRSREFALRTALGASTADVIVLVARQGLAVTATGLIVGLGVTAWLGQAAGAYLHQVSSSDPRTYLLVSVVLFATALVACLVPVRRAIRMEPAAVLRHD